MLTVTSDGSIAQTIQRCSNNLCLVNDLPVEILQKIFIIVRDNDNGNRPFRLPPFPLCVESLNCWVTVSHVCVQWRKAALGCKELWTRIRLSKATARPGTLAKTFLKRSNPLPVFLEQHKIGTRSSAEEKRLRSFHTYLRRHPRRLAGLDSRTDLFLPSQIRLFIPFLSELALRHRGGFDYGSSSVSDADSDESEASNDEEEGEVEAVANDEINDEIDDEDEDEDDWEYTTDVAFQEPILRGSSTTLKRLSLRGIMPELSNFLSLTQLHIINIRGHSFTLSSVLDILRTLSSTLEVLYLVSALGQSEEDPNSVQPLPERERVEMRSLRYVEVRSQPAEDDELPGERTDRPLFFLHELSFSAPPIIVWETSTFKKSSNLIRPSKAQPARCYEDLEGEFEPSFAWVTIPPIRLFEPVTTVLGFCPMTNCNALQGTTFFFNSKLPWKTVECWGEHLPNVTAMYLPGGYKETLAAGLRHFPLLASLHIPLKTPFGSLLSDFEASSESSPICPKLETLNVYYSGKRRHAQKELDWYLQEKGLGPIQISGKVHAVVRSRPKMGVTYKLVIRPMDEFIEIIRSLTHSMRQMAER